jgi:hypothetical protein
MKGKAFNRKWTDSATEDGLVQFAHSVVTAYFGGHHRDCTPKREKLPRVHGQAAVPAQESGEARTGFKPAGVEVEQLPALRATGNCDRRDRIGMDRWRS